MSVMSCGSIGSIGGSVLLQQVITHVREWQGTMSVMSDENAIIDEQIQQTIVQLREIHHACTARAVAHTLGASPDVVRYRCSVLRDRGFVTWDDMPGSLRLVDRVDEVEPAPSMDGESPAAVEPPTSAASSKSSKKKAAPRKATAREAPTARTSKSA
jgi:hypothetical protein